jgi:hypothetical protein
MNLSKDPTQGMIKRPGGVAAACRSERSIHHISFYLFKEPRSPRALMTPVITPRNPVLRTP